jgi:hypothetical protein
MAVERVFIEKDLRHFEFRRRQARQRFDELRLIDCLAGYRRNTLLCALSCQAYTVGQIGWPRVDDQFKYASLPRPKSSRCADAETDAQAVIGRRVDVNPNNLVT